jgi:hypothetical protein
MNKLGRPALSASPPYKNQLPSNVTTSKFYVPLDKNAENLELIKEQVILLQSRLIEIERRSSISAQRLLKASNALENNEFDPQRLATELRDIAYGLGDGSTRRGSQDSNISRKLPASSEMVELSFTKKKNF